MEYISQCNCRIEAKPKPRTGQDKPVRGRIFDLSNQASQATGLTYNKRDLIEFVGQACGLSKAVKRRLINK